MARRVAQRAYRSMQHLSDLEDDDCSDVSPHVLIADRDKGLEIIEGTDPRQERASMILRAGGAGAGEGGGIAGGGGERQSLEEAGELLHPMLDALADRMLNWGIISSSAHTPHVQAPRKESPGSKLDEWH